MINEETLEVNAKVSGMNVYRAVILGLMGTFYGFLVFLMLL